MAPRTVIAGVIMPSPYSNEAPKIASSISSGCAVDQPPMPGVRSGRRAASARMPPSPWLSARITIAMYFTDTTMMRRVEDEGQDAEDVVVVQRDGVRAEEALANRVERTRPDIAVDDANGGERER
jgi:hypothetical protein